MKRIILLLFVILLIIPNIAYGKTTESGIISIGVGSKRDIILYIDGEFVNFPNPEDNPVIIKDTTMVPIRVVSEELGFNVDWSKDTWNKGIKKVWIKDNSTTIELEIGKTKALVNGKEVYINEEKQVEAMLIGNSTYLPLRFIAENMDCLVDWKQSSYSMRVYITSNNGEVLKYVNLERKKAGLKPLALCPELSKVAVIKSEDMAKNDYFAHQSPTYGSPSDLVLAHGVKFSILGENLSKGPLSAEAAVQSWMNSPGHRENMLRTQFNKMGIGLASINGVVHWTQLLSD